MPHTKKIPILSCYKGIVYKSVFYIKEVTKPAPD